MSNPVLLSQADKELADTFHQISEANPDFWSFHGKAQRNNGHAFFHYPAMMVAQMQAVIIDTLISVKPETKVIYDPFVGSGTVMVETMLKGLDFSGQDINPLAILLCKAKSGPMDLNTLEKDFAKIKGEIVRNDSTNIEVDFPNRDKWFRPDVSIALSKIRLAILEVKEVWSRRFFWIALAETVRLTSNSRTSNFKLYTYTEDDIWGRQLTPIETFKDIVQRNLKQFAKQRRYLEQHNLLLQNRYKGNIEIRLGDTTSTDGNQTSELLITSPPYGDNSTTVTYGQFSYLPLQWIQLSDIDNTVDDSYLASTQEIDSRSLGGSKAKALERAESLLQISTSFANTIQELSEEPPDRAKRVASFFSDLELTIDPILSHLAPNSYMVWIVGNRSVGGRQIPMNQILRETLEHRKVQLVCELERSFPEHTKRMGNLTNTMPTEQILVMRKAT